jgi:hypothetical protein
MFRKERRGTLSDIKRSASLTEPSVLEMLNASGLESQPPGSAGKLSRAATVKLLIFPPASAAQRWLTIDVGISGFCPMGLILPLAGDTGDWIVMVPCWPNWEEAEITLVESGNKRLVVMKIFPPGPDTAFAVI